MIKLKKMLKEYMEPDELGQELEYRLDILGAAVRKYSKKSAKWAEKYHISAPATIKIVDTLIKTLMKMR